jgi:glycosyltransferase involved in cell wall biosynthesis
MKVLMIIDSLSLGGAERVLATLSLVAPAAGFHFGVQVLSLPGSSRSVMEPVLEDAGVPVSYLSIRRLADPRALPRIVRAIRASEADVVHAHLEYAAALVPPAARLAKRPAVSTFHHVAVPLSRKEAVKERLAVSVANRGAGVVFVSRASFDSFATVYGGPLPNWRVVENGVDLGRFSDAPDTMPPELGIAPGAPVVTIVGALRWRKGHHVALASWPEVIRHFPDARLLIVGDGPQASALREQAGSLGIAGSVVFAGMRTDVARLMRASQLLALPSQHEALPTTLMEAAACGRPVIASNVDGIPEVVADGETGLLVPWDGQESFAEAVIALLADEPRRREMGLKARALAEERFDARRWAERLYEVYAGVARAGEVPAETLA